MRHVPWLTALAALSIAAPALAADLGDLRPGARVRLRATGSDSVAMIGSVIGLETASGERRSQGTLRVNLREGERAFRLDALESLELSRRRTGRGAVVGGLIGAGIGALLGASAGDDGFISQGGQVVIGAMALGAIGIPVGAWIGYQSRTWRSVPLERTTGWQPGAVGPAVHVTVRW